MKKRLLALAAALALALSACGNRVDPLPGSDPIPLQILCTTYPMYLFTTAVTEGVKGVQVDLLVNSQSSCLHDYTLTVNDMKAIEGADVIVMNGAGLEDFMTDALSRSDATVIDCSESVELLPSLEGDGYDPHYWMDPNNATAVMADLSVELAEIAAGKDLGAEEADFHTALLNAKDTVNEAALGWLSTTSYVPPFITFHDGFQYFARYANLDLLKSIEEEEGAEASAADIKEIVALINEYQIPAIFTEKFGSTSTADAIARETGVEVYQLDLIMYKTGSGIQPYIDAMEKNINTVREALG